MVRMKKPFLLFSLKTNLTLVCSLGVTHYRYRETGPSIQRWQVASTVFGSGNGMATQGGISLRPEYADRNIPPERLFVLVILIKSQHKILKPFSDVFKWMKTLQMRILPIHHECLTVTDLNVYRHEGPSPLQNIVKRLQG